METKEKYIPRELSWVDFNARVLNEATHNPNAPLLEQLNYLSIVSSNFDEFFMVRIAAMIEQIRSGETGGCPTRINPEQQLQMVIEKIRAIVLLQYTHFTDTLVPALKKENVFFLSRDNLDNEQFSFTKEHFHKSVFPVLAPLWYTPDKNQPLIANLGLNIAFLVAPEKGKTKSGLVIVQIPKPLDRIIRIPGKSGQSNFMLIEEIIRMHGSILFPGFRITDSVVFRVTRDADMAIDEKRDEDFVEAVSEVLIDRIAGTPVRLEIERCGTDIETRLADILETGPDMIFRFDGPLNLADFAALSRSHSHEHLRYERWNPCLSIGEEENIWDVLKERDILLHHPYDSFQPVVRLLQEAAEDNDVLSIRMTLYRTSGGSPIVSALSRAAMNGKQVIVLVELKARFDEQNNIEWAQALERRGVIVIYGIARLKVHAKAMLIIRREAEGVKRYIHLGTGNYNEKTARLYTDLSLLSTNDSLSYESALFFNSITGYSSVPVLRELVMAPVALKDKLLSMIRREAERSTKESPGLILAKMNSLADPDIINALYSASRAGVVIKLNIRGICMLRAGVPGLSKNIEVRSVIDRYLEHSRIYYFQNAGREEIYLSSADCMTRNLEKRIELLFPVPDERLRKKVKQILHRFFEDNTNSHIMQPDGTYKRVSPGKRKPFRVQEYFQQEAEEKAKTRGTGEKRDFTVRRKPPGR